MLRMLPKGEVYVQVIRKCSCYLISRETLTENIFTKAAREQSNFAMLFHAQLLWQNGIEFHL